jgi:hypothetical protein
MYVVSLQQLLDSKFRSLIKPFLQTSWTCLFQDLQYYEGVLNAEYWV